MHSFAPLPNIIKATWIKKCHLNCECVTILRCILGPSFKIVRPTTNFQILIVVHFGLCEFQMLSLWSRVQCRCQLCSLLKNRTRGISGGSSITEEKGRGNRNRCVGWQHLSSFCLIFSRNGFPTLGQLFRHGERGSEKCREIFTKEFLFTRTNTIDTKGRAKTVQGGQTPLP